MTYEVRNLIDSLNENGIHVIANKQFDEFAFEFSEHDKKVAEEKDVQIADLKIENKELDQMRKDWMEIAIKHSEKNKLLKKQIEDLEAIIADGKKPDISVSENGVSVGCECGGYNLTKEKITELKKENSELQENLKRYEKIFNSSLGECDCSFARMSELEDRHQLDCIEINRLHTTLEVMTEKYMKLREVHGL